MRDVLRGFGRTAGSAAEVVEANGAEVVQAVLADPPARGVLPRGLGRSYGDSAQNGGGLVLAMRALRAVDDERLEQDGTIRVQAGASLDDLMRTYVPRGWFVPVTTGTRHVTVGGAIAADVHGKNHHVSGSFTRHVAELTLATPTGTRTLRPGDPLFDATCGGMGLTGIVVDAVVRMTPIASSRVLVDTDRGEDLDALLSLMAQGDADYDYSVAWVDCLARGAALGRGVLERGRFARPEELPAGMQTDPLAFRPAERLAVPAVLPTSAVTPLTARAFNELWFRKAPARRRGAVVGLGPYFHPLDGVRGWNALYGPRGFLQYQVVVPFGAEDVLRGIVEGLAAHPAPAAVSVLKRFGPGGSGHLSFPAPGWTLAVDVPARTPGLDGLLDGFDEAVVAAGGRGYLPKDSRMRREHVPAMYPRLAEWQAIRDEADPERVMASDQARRLGLLGDAPGTGARRAAAARPATVGA